MPSPSPPISEPALAAWRAYRQAFREGRPRVEVRAAMERFLAALRPSDRAPFAVWFLGERYDHDALPAEQGSFDRLVAQDVVLPELLAGAREGRADHLRWLAHVVAEGSEPWGLPWDLFTGSREQGLLAAALARNPDAPNLWRTLLRREVEYLSDVGHEMGDGMLLASEAECRTALRSARQLAGGAPAGAISARDLEALAREEAKYAAFFAWRAEGKPGRFHDWLAERMLER